MNARDKATALDIAEDMRARGDEQLRDALRRDALDGDGLTVALAIRAERRREVRRLRAAWRAVQTPALSATTRGVLEFLALYAEGDTLKAQARRDDELDAALALGVELWHNDITRAVNARVALRENLRALRRALRELEEL